MTPARLALGPISVRTKTEVKVHKVAPLVFSCTQEMHIRWPRHKAASCRVSKAWTTAAPFLDVLGLCLKAPLEHFSRGILV